VASAALLGTAVLAGALGGPGPSDASAAAATVVVRPGDTLSAIAARAHTTVAALVAANHIADPDRILAGATLQIPGPGGPAAAPAPVPAPAPPATTVVVRPGDTLSAIAARAHTTVAALVAANRIADPDRILAGARLSLPAPPLPPGWGPGGPLPASLLLHPERVALRPAFVSAATSSGVAPSLLEALCWWESGWQSGATSSTGALGLCQLEPSTVDYARTKLLRNASLDPHLAPDNIAMAAAYLHDLIVRAGGDQRAAVAGYYQGLQSVEQKGMLPSTKTYVTGVFDDAAVFAAAG